MSVGSKSLYVVNGGQSFASDDASSTPSESSSKFLSRNSADGAELARQREGFERARGKFNAEQEQIWRSLRERDAKRYLAIGAGALVGLLLGGRAATAVIGGVLGMGLHAYLEAMRGDPDPPDFSEYIANHSTARRGTTSE